MKESQYTRGVRGTQENRETCPTAEPTAILSNNLAMAVAVKGIHCFPVFSSNRKGRYDLYHSPISSARRERSSSSLVSLLHFWTRSRI